MNDTLSFEACDIRRCVNVTIVNDKVLEGVESLDVTLERTPGLDNKITVTPVDGEIVITDDDGMKTFLHESLHQSVSKRSMQGWHRYARRCAQP